MLDGKKLRQHCDAKHVSPAEIALILGYKTTDSVYKIFRNEVRIKNPDLIERLAKKLGIHASNLIDDDYLRLIFGEEREEYDIVIRVPIVGTVAAGSRNSLISDIGARVLGEVLLSASEGAYGALVEGESMVPRFLDGEALLVDPALPFESGKYYVIRDRAGHTWARRVIKSGNRYILIPDNPHVDLIELEEDEMVYMHRIRFVELR